MIYHIAIIDDDQFDRTLISNYINDFFNKHEFKLSIIEIDDPKKLDLESIALLDIVFLDIEFPNYNGINFAKHLYAKFPRTKLVFISNQNELIYEASKVNFYDFIRKSKIHEEINDTLLRITSELNQIIILHRADEDRKVFMKDIIWIEVFGNYINFYTSYGKFSERNTLKNIQKELPSSNFKKINKAFIINMDHIESLSKDSVVLSNGDSVLINCRNISQLKKEILQYIERDSWL